MRALAVRLTPGAVTLFAYFACSYTFSEASRDGGLLTPEASVDPVVLVLGAATLALRLTLLFAVAPATVMAVVRAGIVRAGP